MARFFSRVYIVDGFILKRRNTGEADRILTLFTKRLGKIRVIAKGIRRPNSRRAGHLEVFGRITATLHKGKTLDVLSEVQQYGHGEGQFAVMHQIVIAYYMCELVDKLLADNQEHDDVFELLRVLFGRLLKTTTSEESLALSYEFALSLLQRLGFLPTHRKLTEQQVNPYIESIVERKLRTWHLLTKVMRAS